MDGKPVNNFNSEFVDACRYRYFSDAKELLERGASVEAVNRSGHTPLIDSSIDGRDDTVIFLLENGADIEVKDMGGDTPLSCVSNEGNENIVKILLGHGANVDTVNMYGNTPLIEAIKYRNIGIAKLLLEYGADTEVRNKDGKTFEDLLNFGDKKEIEDFYNRSSIKPAKQ